MADADGPKDQTEDEERRPARRSSPGSDAPEKGGVEGFITKKVAGVPLWVWAIGAGVVLIFIAKKGKQQGSSASGPGTGTGVGSENMDIGGGADGSTLAQLQDEITALQKQGGAAAATGNATVAPATPVPSTGASPAPITAPRGGPLPGGHLGARPPAAITPVQRMAQIPVATAPASPTTGTAATANVRAPISTLLRLHTSRLARRRPRNLAAGAAYGGNPNNQSSMGLKGGGFKF